jgi:hypothetical protein
MHANESGHAEEIAKRANAASAISELFPIADGNLTAI